MHNITQSTYFKGNYQDFLKEFSSIMSTDLEKTKDYFLALTKEANIDWLNKDLCYRVDVGYWLNNTNVKVEVIGNIYDNDMQIDKDTYINKYQALKLFEKHSYPVKYDGNSIEQGMTITGIRQVINELSSVNNLARKVMGNISELEIYCPNCGGINIYEITHDDKFIEYSYCPDCGQKLDWSDMK